MDIIFPFTLFLLIVPGFFIKNGQKEKERYFAFAATLLGVLLILRAPNVGADLGRYRTHFNQVGILSFLKVWQYTSSNQFFYYWMYIIHKISNGNYQFFLILTAIASFIPPMLLFKWNSKDPYFSILAYFCFGFYAFIFSGLKQAMAMAMLTLAFQAILTRKANIFIGLVVLASFFHFSAVIALPTYFIAHRPKTKFFVLIYLFVAVFIYIFKYWIVQCMLEEYTASTSSTELAGVGGKVILIALIAGVGYIFCTPDKDLTPDVRLIYFKFMLVAAILQIFAVYGNVFERLADYYFFYICLYLPEITHSMENQNVENSNLVCINSNALPIVKFSVVGILVIYFVLYVLGTPGLSTYRTWIAG